MGIFFIFYMNFINVGIYSIKIETISLLFEQIEFSYY